MEKVSVEKTVKTDLCIGCGVCEPSCPFDAISIFYNKNKEYRPEVNDKCTLCGICYAVCPMSVPNLNSRLNSAVKSGKEYGLQNALSFNKGYQENYSEYIKSSSGGVLSALLIYLLENKYIDAVIHAEQQLGNSKNVYFKASVSRTKEEINNKRSSFYHPIDFSGVLKEINSMPEIKTVAVTGTPCVISALKNLKTYNKKTGKKIKYIFSLMCSHNVSGFLTQNLAESFNKGDTLLYFKHRDKEGVQNSGNFNNSIQLPSGEKYTNSRFKSPFTLNWRSFSYSFNGCLYCPDFFGVDADAGFKDAWNLNEERKEGETAYFVRNIEISDVFEKMISEGIIKNEELGKQTFIGSQQVTAVYKTHYAAFRQKRNKYLKKGRSKNNKVKYGLLEKLFLLIDFKLKKFNINFSKKRKRKKNKNVPNYLLKIFELFLRKTGVYLNIIYKFKEQNKQKEILYTAGFGHNNIGDEAQLSTNLKLWKEIAPDYKVTILSPRPDYTRTVHGNYDILPASRNNFWGFSNIEYAGIGTKNYFKLFFRFRFFKLKISAFFVKHFNRAIFVSPESAYLLKRIKQAKVLHIGGGGYLTGKTFSRLYDYMGLIHIANQLNTDVILSGHNIGIWKTGFQKRIAKKLKKAKYIGLRDNKNSIEDLKTIGVYNPEKVFTYFDDALFCEGFTKNQLNKFLSEQGISSENGYITVNVHFWEALKKELVFETIKKLAAKIDKIALEQNKIVLLVAMHSQDVQPLKYLKKNMNEKAYLISHNDNIQLVVGIYHNSYLTITMKHHPIIFSMAGAVPTISVAFESYANHKNIGAMSLFGQSEYALEYTALDNGVFDDKLSYLLKNKDFISKQILEKIQIFEKDKGAIIKKYTENY
jgi:coenzyme F420 hydrogenase subunit beta